MLIIKPEWGVHENLPYHYFFALKNAVKNGCGVFGSWIGGTYNFVCEPHIKGTSL